MGESTSAIVAYSYIRFSHPDQAKGDSLRRQTEAAVDWCKRHGIQLDESTTLRDLGKSAYLGKHRENPDRYALAGFLKMVETGKIPKGSYLIIENLDRLSREEERPALRLWMDLLDSGINIVQLHPETIFRHEKSDMVDIMRAIIELSRGHSESARKSERNGAAWEARRKKAREGSEFLTHRLPAWIEVRGGKLAIIAERKAVIRRIFALAAAGYGAAGIVQKLTEEEIPAFGPSGHWTRTYIAVILRDRRALGELQPRRSNGQPDGEPIKKYFPAAVNETEWYAARGRVTRARRPVSRGRAWTEAEDAVVKAQPAAVAAQQLRRSIAAVRARRHILTRPAKPAPARDPGQRHINVFAGLLRDAGSDDSFYVATRSSRRYGTRWRVLLNVASAEGRAPAKSFPFPTFEHAVLSMLQEIDPHEILNGDDGPDDSQALAGDYAKLELELTEATAFMEANGFSKTIGQRVKALETQLGQVAERLAEARRRAAHPQSEAWGEVQTLAEALDSAPDPYDARVRLRSLLRRIVDEIRVLIVRRGKTSLCAVQIWFSGGSKHRDYFILHRPAQTKVQTLADAAKLGPLDLRKREHAKRLEAFLTKLDLKVGTEAIE